MYLNNKAIKSIFLIEETITIKNIKPLPLDKLHQIENLINKEASFKYASLKKENNNSKKLPTEAKLQKAQMSATDTCLTAILKIIGRKDLIEKCRGSSFVFLMNYIKEGGSLIEITSLNKNDLKKGHIIVWLDESKFKSGKFPAFQLNDFDPEIGVYSRPTSLIGGVAHFGIILDPEKNIVLHNKFVGTDKNGDPLIAGGSGLKLAIEKYPLFKNSKKSSKKLYVLDYNVIKKMKCNKLKD